MATVTLPAGVIPVKSLTTGDILRGYRHTGYRIEQLSRTEASLGTLKGSPAGSLDWNAAAPVHSGGSLSVVDVGQPVDWLNDRIRPWLLIDGLPPQPLGIYIAGEAPEKWGGTGRRWTVGLLDKTAILEQNEIADTYSLAAGTVITTTVIALIASTGETRYAITPSSATLPAALAWDPGTSLLRIVNDLLSVAGYFSLWCDETGQYRGEPYTRPAARPIRWEFLDGPGAIYDPDFERDRDLFIPNKVIAVGQGDSTTEALVSTALNTSPASPYSTVNRGTPGNPRIISKTETGIEAADQATLDAYARRRLIELTSPASTIPIRHAPIPGLAHNHAVRLRHTPAQVDARHVITTTSLTLVDGTALATSTLQEVVDL